MFSFSNSEIAGKPHFLANGVTWHGWFFSPWLLSFFICTRNLISISFHPVGQCYLLFCFLPIIDSTQQNRLQLLAELFFPLGTEKIFIKRKCLVSLSAGLFSVEIQARPSWKFQTLLGLYFQWMYWQLSQECISSISCSWSNVYLYVALQKNFWFWVLYPQSQKFLRD